MSTRQTTSDPVSDIEVDFADRTGPVLTDAQYAEALRRIGGVAATLRLLAQAIDWDVGAPTPPAFRRTLH